MIILEDVYLSYPILDIGAHSLQIAIKKKISKLIGVGGHIDYSSSKAYVNALNGVSMQIKDGDRVGIVGHNGSGKTTLLRLLSGVFSPTQGSITIQGNVQSLTDFTLGMDPDVSGIKNILFRLVFMGYTFKGARAAVDEIIEFSGLGEFIHLPVRTYSTGMFLRLAFAISTHVPPDILILDEIIGAGDEAFREKMMGRLNDLFQKSRIVVLSSHDLEAIKKYCNVAVMMKHGKIVSMGDPQEVIDYYCANG
jgi:ABC-type polysaccharide/polyol phosphate transport system ATPase subunit